MHAILHLRAVILVAPPNHHILTTTGHQHHHNAYQQQTSTARDASTCERPNDGIIDIGYRNRKDAEL
jgi:hypothetical protein